MEENWTVDIPLRTPDDRQASKDEVTTSGTVLGKPAVLVTKGSSIRLKVSGFDSREAAEGACPRLCFGLQYMSLHVAVAVAINPTPQRITSHPDPVVAASNISQTFGGTNFGTEIHGIMQAGSPAIYPTSHKILMLTGGSVTFTITGIGNPDDALQWIAVGADMDYAAVGKIDGLALANELFNLAGFEPSPSAAFIVHCTALEQLFPPEVVDPITVSHIERMAAELKKLSVEAQSEAERQALERLRDRILILKRDSKGRAVQGGVVETLASADGSRASELLVQLREINRVRNKLAHEGRAELGTAAQQLQDILKAVLLMKFTSHNSA